MTWKVITFTSLRSTNNCIILRFTKRASGRRARVRPIELGGKQALRELHRSALLTMRKRVVWAVLL